MKEWLVGNIFPMSSLMFRAQKTMSKCLTPCPGYTFIVMLDLSDFVLIQML